MDKLSDLAADSLEHVRKDRFFDQCVSREEFDNTQKLALDLDWNTDRAYYSGTCCGFASRIFSAAESSDQPNRCIALPNLARDTYTTFKPGSTAFAFKLSHAFR